VKSDWHIVCLEMVLSGLSTSHICPGLSRHNNQRLSLPQFVNIKSRRMCLIGQKTVHNVSHKTWEGDKRALPRVIFTAHLTSVGRPLCLKVESGFVTGPYLQ
jgi:hypothetical protein